MPSESRGSSDQSQSEGSQSDSSSDDFDLDVSSFLKAFPNPPLLMRDKSGFGHGWVFCSQSENNSSSVDVGVPMNIIHDKIISAFSNIDFRWWSCLAQFWEPVTIHGRLLLSNFGQPFVVTHLNKDFVEYRLDSEKYKYIIDVKNKLHTEGDPMISSGGPATAFLNRFLYTIVPLEENDDERGKLSFMLPVCFQSQSSCVGVLELHLYDALFDVTDSVLLTIKNMQEVGLDVCNAQEQIPYKTINGLRAAEDEIEHALQIVCGSHNLSLAQVWIGVKDKSHVPLSSYSGDTQKVFGLKLTGYLLNKHEDEAHEMLAMYNRLCDLIPWRCTEKHALKTLQDFKSRYISTLNDDMLLSSTEINSMASSFVICLRSNDTGDFNYAFEFIWLKHSNYAILLEALLSTLKRCLPSFKFASGAELDDESDVIEVHCSNHIQTHTLCIPTYNEICNFKIFKGKTSSPIPKALEEGKQPVVKCKTTEILLTREDIEKHFDKTMKEAAKNLKVSESTLKRKLRKLGIDEWPRTKPVKRNKKDLSINQIETNEEDNGAIQEPSTMTIKAEYAGRMIKSCLLISQATFETIVKEIGVKFKLSLGTYDVMYLDEDEDWILLTSDEEMSDCIKSSRKSDRVQIAGLDVCNVQEQIPYKTINGLRAVKEEIENVLQIVCGLHDISLAQVWIGVKDKSHVPLSSYSGDTQRVFGLKLTGYLLDEHEYKLQRYSRLCDVMPRRCTQKHALKTLQDFKSRYISTLNDDALLSGEVDNFMVFSKNMASLVICLRSNDTGDIDYAFEFILPTHSNYAFVLEPLLSTLKRCLPSFKFASGAELDDESDVIEVDCSKHNPTVTLCIPTYNEICNFKIFQGKTSSPIPKPLEVGKQPTVVDYIATSKKTTPEVLPLEYTQKHLYGIGDESPTTSSIKVVQGKRLSRISKSVEEGKKPMVKFKTAEILLTREDIEKHFDKTMKEAAKNLKVSESTLKRKLRKLGIEEWPRTKLVKRNKNDLSINQIETNEEDNGAIQEPSTMTIKAEYAGRMIKSCLLISQATFETIVKEIGVKFKLSLGTYDVTYLDEDGDWILLTSDEEMSDCIKSSRKSDRVLVRLRVLPSTN